uniref:Arf-GAP domain-containing protein n=3 Tax=Mesocestoides corti TaxID=53468 RepID=A0A5K3FA33_MESCO
MPSLSGPDGIEDVNSNDIRQEITRFESVHPSIYAMYDLIESLADRRQADLFRRQVASVEDAFVNSQEWTLGHTVPQIKLGLLGSVHSGKSALVHRYLTGTYLQDESPEGGRFKKEVVLDGLSYLLLIRDEGGAPDEQFSRWIDGAVFVFSLDSEDSFRVVCEYFERLDSFRETHDLPIILVGTQDSTSESNPRVIDDSKARRLAISLNKCPYYETCSTYGLNVERVFQDACIKIVQSRPDLSYLLPTSSVQPPRAQPFQMFQQRSQSAFPVQQGFSPQICPPNPYRDRGMPLISQFQSGTIGGDPNMAGCLNTQVPLQCMYANTTARAGSYPQRLPPLPVDNGTNGCINTNTSGGILTTQSAECRRPDMHNNPGFEPDFGDSAHCIISRPSSFAQLRLFTEGGGVGDCSTIIARPVATVLSVPLELPKYLQPPSLPDTYWGVHPFISSDPDQSNVAQWYATSNPSLSDLGKSPGSDKSGSDSGWPTLSRIKHDSRGEAKDSLTPSSTPTQSRKTRPKSNLFKKSDESREKEKKGALDGIGSGRSIPIKQGYLYKRTCKPLSKEWKTKKYVALTDDARLIYHSNIQDYVQNAHGKEIDLSRVTVKIPGVIFRQTGGQVFSNGSGRNPGVEATSDKLAGSSLENTSGPPDQGQASSEGSMNPGNRPHPQQGTKENSNKRYRRVKSSQKAGAADGYESEGYEFQLISMDRQWNFEAHSSEDRDDWVAHIDQAIIMRLQLLDSSKRTGESQIAGGSADTPSNSWGGGSHSLSGGGGGSDPGTQKDGGSEKAEIIRVDEAMAKSLRSVAGNDTCADCGAPDPDWASLNLGEMVCIECSGVHRKLGTHISRIRSLMLDDWTKEAIAVMRAIGNTLANSVWEAAVPGNAANRRKPDSHSSKEEMEAWIRAKYEHREFLPPLPYPEAPLQQQLIDAIARQDTRQVILCLARATPDTVNAPYSRHDPRAAIHIAATLGNIVYLQLLLWYNGNPSVMDAEGRNAFYYAHCSYHFDCASFLARNGCPRQAVPTPSPALFSSAAVAQQPPHHHQQQQRPPPPSAQQQQQQVKSPPAHNPMTPKHQHSAFQQQQQSLQQMGYRGSSGSPSMASGLPPPTPQSVMPGQIPSGFAPVYMHNIMPVSTAAPALHGTMAGNALTPQMTPATVAAAGATLPRRRSPFPPQAVPQGGYLAQPCPAGAMANRPLPVAGGFDPTSGRALVSGLAAPPLVSSLNAPAPLPPPPPPGAKPCDGNQEIGI